MIHPEFIDGLKRTFRIFYSIFKVVSAYFLILFGVILFIPSLGWSKLMLNLGNNILFGEETKYASKMGYELQ